MIRLMDRTVPGRVDSLVRRTGKPHVFVHHGRWTGWASPRMRIPNRLQVALWIHERNREEKRGS